MGGSAIIAEKKYKEFDNFYLSSFWIDDLRWMSSEHYYQAMKNHNQHYQLTIQMCTTASEAWKLGQECPLRPDWEEIKVGIMFRANLCKFSQNQDLGKLLTNTGDTPIIFTRSTPFWNENNAKILTEVREILRRYSNA